MMDGTLGTISDNAGFTTIAGEKMEKAQDSKCENRGRVVTQRSTAWYGSNGAFIHRTAITILEQVTNACNLELPQGWKMKSKRCLGDMKDQKGRDAVMDSARRWFRGNSISMSGITDDGVFESFRVALNTELNLGSSKHGVSSRWYDFTSPDRPALSSFLSVGRQLVWENRCIESLNNSLDTSNSPASGERNESVSFNSVSKIDLAVSEMDENGKTKVSAYCTGEKLDLIDPLILQQAIADADEATKAIDAPGLAQTDLSQPDAERVIVDALMGIIEIIVSAYGYSLDNWQPYYNKDGTLLEAHPLTRLAQFAQSWEYDSNTNTIYVSETSELSDQDAVDQFIQQLILDVSADQCLGNVLSEKVPASIDLYFNIGGAHFNSMFAINNSILYSILELQQTQEAMLNYAIAEKSFDTCSQMLQSCREELIKLERPTDLLDEQLENYSSALRSAYMYMMICLMHLGPVNQLKNSILQPNFMMVEDISIGIHMNTASGMFILDNENLLWEDRFGRF